MDTVSSRLTPAGDSYEHRSSEHKADDLPVQDGGSVSNDVTIERLRGIVDWVLDFFANASNGTLLACASGLVAATYFVLGRFGLLLIGVACGVVLHATWETYQHKGAPGKGESSINARKREVGAEVVKRVLDWRESSQKDQKENGEVKERENAPAETLDFSTFPSATSAALTGFIDAIIRDYVHYWYAPMIPGEKLFPESCRQILTSFILSISNHLSRKRAADPVLDFLANATSILIVFLNELSAAIKASPRQEAENAVRNYLKHKPDSNLANVLSTQQQERKLNLVAEDVLQSFLDPKAFAFAPTRVFLREILANLVLDQTIIMCSKHDWINGWIEYLLQDGEPELLNVIDAGVENMSEAMAHGEIRVGPISPKGHQRRVSRAEEAMQEALLEAKRMNELIALEDEKRRQESAIDEGIEASSTTTTDAGLATPTSSESGRIRVGDRSLESSMMFEGDGNLHTPATTSQNQSLFGEFEQSSSILQESNPALQASPASSLADTSSIAASILTIHNASITIYDDADPADRSVIKSKPGSDYLIQIEPASSKFPGWMIPRKYADFEPLHETLRRIAVISGAAEFADRFITLPVWKGRSRNVLTQDLEQYLQYALQFERLAESEAMKKFLDKDRGLDKVSTQTKNVLVQSGAALENVGKGFINVLGQGGKGIAGGGKAVLGGVQGVFGAVATGVGAQKRPGLPTNRASQNPSKMSLGRGYTNGMSNGRDAMGAHDDSADISKPPPLPSRPRREAEEDQRRSRSSSRTRAEQSFEAMKLPPPPSDIMDDYMPPRTSNDSIAPQLPPRAASPASSNPVRSTIGPVVELPAGIQEDLNAIRAKDVPITEEETRISIELMFAIITELYSLSSAWTIRLSLLAAAKTFLLRPNNPQLESIRVLLQETVVDANFSDTGLATHINKMRENALPTQDELKSWPPPLTLVESEKLRVKARKLLIERGMPQALTSVMGAAASGEALGRVFDCLQVEEVARGLIFALLLQVLRAATQ